MTRHVRKWINFHEFLMLARAENEKSFLPVAVIKTPYTRQGDLTDSFVNRAGGALASFARLIKINGEQVQGLREGLGSLVSRRPKGCSHGERAGAKKNYKNNLAEEGAVNWGGKLA